MKELRVVGTTPNGDGVILSDDKGAKFLVANDPRLAAATRELSRQLEMALQTFSPREIQSRVRGGASAEVIAAETGWPLDKVLRYAEPLLAEREYIAQQAYSVEIRRSGGGATLLESASEVLGVEPDSAPIRWDAWRREDGKWVVTASYTDARGAHGAQWTYDHVGRNLHPLDDDARELMGARPVAVAQPDRDDIDDIEQALGLVSDHPALQHDQAPAETRPRLVAVPDADDEGDRAAEADVEVPSPAPVTHSHATVTIPQPAEAEGTPAQEPEPAASTERKAPARKPKARKGRASVPSWDEILFGTSHPEE
jgi:hypothetical protein